MSHLIPRSKAASWLYFCSRRAAVCNMTDPGHRLRQQCESPSSAGCSRRLKRNGRLTGHGGWWILVQLSYSSTLLQCYSGTSGHSLAGCWLLAGALVGALAGALALAGAGVGAGLPERCGEENGEIPVQEVSMRVRI
jgi:hypothetical protein